MDFTRDLDYRLNNAFNLIEAAEYEFAMREAILYETNSICQQNIIPINESFAESVKQFFENIPKFLEEAYNKFMELITIKWASDSKIFDKYGDILEKDCKLGEANLYNYNITLLKHQMTDFNYESIKDKLVSEEEAQKAIFPNYFKDDSGMNFDNFKERVKYILRGAPSGNQVPKITLNNDKFKEIVDFIKNFKITKNTITSDKKTVLKQIINLKNFIKQKENETATQESYYSYLFGKSVLLEEENSDNKEDSPASGTINKDDQKDNNPDSDKDKAADKIVDSDDNKKSGSFAEEFKKAKLAIRVITQFFSAKMSIASSIYKEYRNIINEHIKSYGKNINDVEEKEDKAENSENNTNDQDNKDSEDEAGKEVIKDIALEPDGSIKNMNDEQKAEFRNGLKKAWKSNPNKASTVFNKIMSKMNKKK